MRIPIAIGTALALSACGPSPAASNAAHAVRLFDAFRPECVRGSAPGDSARISRTEWRFDGKGTVAPPATVKRDTNAASEKTDDFAATQGWRALHDVDELAVSDGLLMGKCKSDAALISIAKPGDVDAGDLVHGLEVRLRVSAGTKLDVHLDDDEKLDADDAAKDARESDTYFLSTPLQATEDFQTCTVSTQSSPFAPSFPIARLRNIVIRPSEAAGARFAIESVRLITRKEHLASIASGPGWHGLSDVYRETIVARAPERILLDVEVPERAWLDLAVGSLDAAPLTFVVRALPPVETSAESGTQLARRTLTTANRWEELPVDLSGVPGRRARLELALEAEHLGAIGFWGGVVVRSRVAPSKAAPDRPRGVILIVADTLRRDHVQPFGSERPTAPVLARLAREGALFTHDVSQGTWTKVSVPSILSSLYPSTHGIRDIPDRLPSSVTTLAEAFRSAGFATFATSSVPFTGKLSNLHQGVDVLHERASLGELGHSASKTSRAFVDRLLAWIEVHKDGPFFAFLHVFDPHSPFEPYAPWEARFAAPDAHALHAADVERVRPLIKDDFMKSLGLPRKDELEAAGIDADAFVAREKAWYDASIAAMDAEIGRLIERLEGLGLRRDVVVAFTSDHGEEFLEHGRHWHGNNTYGEMLNVPLLMWGPGNIPAGLVIDETVQSIDVYPTLLDLCRIAIPSRAQGQSLLPLMTASAGTDRSAAGRNRWRPRPAFAERVERPGDKTPDPRNVDSFAIVWDGWKLVHNVKRPDGVPEFQLFDARSDPLDQRDVAAEHSDVVTRLAGMIATWQMEAKDAKPTETEGQAELAPEELERLRALGYVR